MAAGGLDLARAAGAFAGRPHDLRVGRRAAGADVHGVGVSQGARKPERPCAGAGLRPECDLRVGLVASWTIPCALVPSVAVRMPPFLAGNPGPNWYAQYPTGIAYAAGISAASSLPRTTGPHPRILGSRASRSHRIRWLEGDPGSAPAGAGAMRAGSARRGDCRTARSCRLLGTRRARGGRPLPRKPAEPRASPGPAVVLPVLAAGVPVSGAGENHAGTVRARASPRFTRMKLPASPVPPLHAATGECRRSGHSAAMPLAGSSPACSVATFRAGARPFPILPSGAWSMSRRPIRAFSAFPV